MGNNSMHLHTCLDANTDSDTSTISDADQNRNSYGDAD